MDDNEAKAKVKTRLAAGFWEFNIATTINPTET
jgi:hypothetical protein